MSNRETRLRSIVKTIIYRVLTVVCIDFPIVYLGLLFLGYDEPHFAMGLSLLFEISHSIFYYIYERVWSRIHWGYR